MPFAQKNAEGIMASETATPRDLITPREAARLVGTHLSTVHRWLHSGRLRGWRRAGTRYLVSRAEVLAVIQPVAVGEVETPRTAAEDAAAAERAREYLRARGYRV